MMLSTRRELLWAVVGSIAGGYLVYVSDAAAATAGPGDMRWRRGVAVGPCKLVRVLSVDVARGCMPVVLVDPRGRELVVEVHRFDARAQRPLARAGSLAVYLRNGGDGATPSDETHGLGAMALAAMLEAHERAGGALPRLASIGERWRVDPPRAC
jgi:hypothetical protein